MVLAFAMVKEFTQLGEELRSYVSERTTVGCLWLLMGREQREILTSSWLMCSAAMMLE